MLYADDAFRPLAAASRDVGQHAATTVPGFYGRSASPVKEEGGRPGRMMFNSRRSRPSLVAACSRHIFLPAHRSKRALQHAADAHALRAPVESQRLALEYPFRSG